MVINYGIIKSILMISLKCPLCYQVFVFSFQCWDLPRVLHMLGKCSAHPHAPSSHNVLQMVPSLYPIRNDPKR